MSAEIIRPDSTIVATGVSITGAATAHDAVDDVVVQPTNPGTSEFVQVGASDTLELGFANPSSSDVLARAVQGIRVALYGNRSSLSGVPVGDQELRKNDGTVLGSFGSPGLSDVWVTLTISVAGLSVADLNGLKIRLAGLAGTTQLWTIHALYLELFTASPLVAVT